MKMYLKAIWCCILFVAMVSSSCRDTFIPDINSNSNNNLVVEGRINLGAGNTKIRLSRVAVLDSKISIVPELNAKLQVEGNDNSVRALQEQGDGLYYVALTGLDNTKLYRLRITTASSKVYLSDFTPSLITYPIDNISWQRQTDGVQIAVNVNAPASTSRYYKWEYDELYQYNSYVLSQYKYLPFEDRVTLRNSDEIIHSCWTNSSSTEILIGSTAALSQNKVSNSAIRFIQNASKLLGVRYYINVKQYALTLAEYNFYTQMKKNTELTGSVFDQQPSESVGNIHCITSPDEIVIGYIGVSTLQEKSIFINNSSLPNWNYLQSGTCATSALQVLDTPTELRKYFTLEYIPVAPVVDPTGKPIAWSALPYACVDCTVQGGVNSKPSFW